MFDVRRRLRWTSSKRMTVSPSGMLRSIQTDSAGAVFHILAFNRRGGLLWPGGADPLALRVAEGAYRNNQPSPNTRSTKPNIAENHLQIGRHIGRPYRTDG
jgi:hypothetical protein